MPHAARQAGVRYFPVPLLETDLLIGRVAHIASTASSTSPQQLLTLVLLCLGPEPPIRLARAGAVLTILPTGQCLTAAAVCAALIFYAECGRAAPTQPLESILPTGLVARPFYPADPLGPVLSPRRFPVLLGLRRRRTFSSSALTAASMTVTPTWSVPGITTAVGYPGAPAHSQGSSPDWAHAAVSAPHYPGRSPRSVPCSVRFDIPSQEKSARRAPKLSNRSRSVIQRLSNRCLGSRDSAQIRQTLAELGQSWAEWSRT